MKTEPLKSWGKRDEALNASKCTEGSKNNMSDLEPGRLTSRVSCISNPHITGLGFFFHSTGKKALNSYRKSMHRFPANHILERSRKGGGKRQVSLTYYSNNRTLVFICHYTNDGIFLISQALNTWLNKYIVPQQPNADLGGDHSIDNHLLIPIKNMNSSAFPPASHHK